MLDEQNKPVPSLDFATFLRKFEQRHHGLMWFLGAGASRASGIKTAGDMIWDFKARLYRSAQSVPASSVADLSDQRVRDTLQQFFDAQDKYPAAGAEEEYSYYFEETYPEGQDRRTYIDHLMKRAKPSFGHKALAQLMKCDLCRLVWTTNFDRVFEDAVSEVFETQSVMMIGDLGEPEKVQRGYAQQQWPIYAKLHGDFHSDALKNTFRELASQDTKMWQVLVDACRNGGLVVTGYSGRDQSINSALRDAVNDGLGFPNGLFWFVREQDHIFREVSKLISEANSKGVDAAFVKLGGFDELLSDLVRYLPQTEQIAIQLDDQRKLSPRKIDLSDRRTSISFVRTNAIPIIEFPKTSRLVDCNIGGMAEVQEAISKSGSNLIASRIKKGVLIFGDDAEVKRLFGGWALKSLTRTGLFQSACLLSPASEPFYVWPFSGH